MEISPHSSSDSDSNSTKKPVDGGEANPVPRLGPPEAAPWHVQSQ